MEKPQLRNSVFSPLVEYRRSLLTIVMQTQLTLQGNLTHQDRKNTHTHTPHIPTPRQKIHPGKLCNSFLTTPWFQEGTMWLFVFRCARSRTPDFHLDRWGSDRSPPTVILFYYSPPVSSQGATFAITSASFTLPLRGDRTDLEVLLLIFWLTKICLVWISASMLFNKKSLSSFTAASANCHRWQMRVN